MSIDDFWKRLYDFSSDLHPVSDATWGRTLDDLVNEFKKFPAATRDALRSHLAILIGRLTQLQTHLP